MLTATTLDKKNEKYAGAHNPPRPSELPVPEVGEIFPVALIKTLRSRRPTSMRCTGLGRRFSKAAAGEGKKSCGPFWEG